METFWKQGHVRVGYDDVLSGVKADGDGNGVVPSVFGRYDAPSDDAVLDDEHTLDTGARRLLERSTDVLTMSVDDG